MPPGAAGRPGRTGRRPGRPDTRRVILDAARDLFAQHGYAGTSIRQIAAAAEVDPALVHHYFGPKESLFRAALDIPIRPAELVGSIFSEGLEAAPERLVRTFLGVWDDAQTGSAMASFLRTAVGQETAAGLLREFFATSVLPAVAARISERHEPAEAQLRVSLVASQLLGLALTRRLLKVEPIASTSADALVAAVTPTIAHYLFGNLRDHSDAPARHQRPEETT